MLKASEKFFKPAPKEVKVYSFDEMMLESGVYVLYHEKDMAHRAYFIVSKTYNTEDNTIVLYHDQPYIGPVGDSWYTHKFVKLEGELVVAFSNG
jgi:hypothetical protein